MLTSVEPGVTQLLGLPTRLLLGAGIGVAGGIGMGALLRNEEFLPTGLENVTTLALVLALFEVSEAIQPESGIMSAAVASLFARSLPGATADGAAFQALVFSVIALTVAVQGGTARWLMERLELGAEQGEG